jgi:peroxiredoxin
MAAIIPVNEIAPLFTLPDLHGQEHSLADWRGKIVLLNFWSAECPWSARADEELLAAQAGWEERVVLVTLASNANEPADLVRQVAAQRGLPLVLVDAEQRAADLYGAETTPHVFVIGPEGVLRYQGAVNDMTFRKRTPEQFYAKDAVQALLEGRLPDPAQTNPYGCTIVRFS